MRLAICTGGGDCSGLNATISFAVKTQIYRYNSEIYGVYDSLDGLVKSSLGLKKLSLDDVEDIMFKGGTILGSKSAGNPFGIKDKSDKNAVERVISSVKANLSKLQIDALIVIGGEGTQHSAALLSNNGINVIGIPKTIDNDLMDIYHPIGFQTAVAVCSDSLEKFKSCVYGSKQVHVVEVMGRYSGFLALESGVSVGADAILLPEIPYSLEELVKFISKSKERLAKPLLIVISEGAHPTGDSPSEQKSFSGKKILKGAGAQLTDELQSIGINSQLTVLGHIQRGGKPDVLDRKLASLYGSEAVHRAHKNQFGSIVSYKEGKIEDIPYESMKGRARKINVSKDKLISVCRSIGIFLGKDKI